MDLLNGSDFESELFFYSNSVLQLNNEMKGCHLFMSCYI